MRISDGSSDVCSSDLSGIDEMVREAELEDARKALESTRHGNLQRTIGNAIDPEGELTSEVKSVEREAGREPGASASEAAPSAEAGKDRSEEHTSELQSLMRISYAVVRLKKKKSKRINN